MKRTIVLAIFVLTAIAAHAQVAKSSDFSYLSGNFYRNGEKLTQPQLYDILGHKTYNETYKPAISLWAAGVSCLTVGCVTTSCGAGMMVYSMAADYSMGEVINSKLPLSTGIIVGSIGAAITIAGGVLYGIGNNRLKKIVPASGGAGLAYVF